MNKEGLTIRGAVEMWVREFNEVPQEMIADLMREQIDEWHELTKPSYGNSVSLYSMPEEDEDGNEYEGSCIEGEIVEVLPDDEYIIELNDGIRVQVEEGEFEVESRYDLLPMWGTMWSFGDGLDDEWLAREDGIRKMSNCGFRIFESERYGFYFGIDGAGYDFYENHWVPLYKERGLAWHDKNTER